MEIFYNFQTNQWECREQNIYWGQTQKLTYSPSSTHSPLQFYLNENNNHIGPLVGILTGKNENNQLTGSGPLFRHLQEMFIEYQGLTVVFTMEDVFQEGVHGFMYQPTMSRWYEVTTPLPNIIYNRLPYDLNDSERFEKFQTFCHRKKIPILNPFFLSIHESCQLLTKSIDLKKHVPFFQTVHSKHQLIKTIQQLKELYIIPKNSYQKKDILLLQLTTSSHMIISRNGVQKHYSSFEQFFYEYDYLFSWGPIFIQQYIPAMEQFTVLVHPMQKNNITAIDWNEYTQPSMKSEQFIKMSIPTITNLLQKNYGTFIEFAVEVTIHQGNYYITHLHSKPLRFDSFQIEETRVKTLTENFFHLTKFPFI